VRFFPFDEMLALCDAVGAGCRLERKVLYGPGPLAEQCERQQVPTPR
jgi:hypothetical protein